MPRYLILLVASVVTALARPHLHAQAVPVELRDAMAIVSIVYPDLVGRTRHVVLTGERQVRVDVADVDALDRGGDRRPQLTVDLRFDREGRLLRLEAAGAFVSTPRNAVLRERVRAVPRGQESTLRGWLRDRGARFGPDNPPVFERSPEDLRRVTGLPTQAQPGGFRWRDPGTGEAEPGWVVLLSGTDDEGLPRTFAVLLEPVNGRVVRLVREER